MPDTNSNYPNWHNSVSGAVAGLGSRATVAPLDLLRIRRQLDRSVTYPRPSLWTSLKTIVRDEGGILALYRGGMAATYLWIGYATVQFSVYGTIKRELEMYMDKTNSRNSTVVAFISGGTAGLCATWATYPFDICRTTFAARGVQSAAETSSSSFRPPKSLLEFATTLYRQKGIKAFYAGSGPASIQIVPYMGINFAIYDTLTSGDRAMGLSAFAGTISGSVSKLIIYPIDTVKKRLQVQSVFGPSGDNYTGMINCVVKILKQEGFLAFYRGLIPSVLKTGIGTGLTFSLFRGTKNLLEAIHDGET